MKVLRIIEEDEKLVIRWHTFTSFVKSIASYRELDLHIVTGNRNSEKARVFVKGETHLTVQHILDNRKVWIQGEGKEGLFNVFLLQCLEAILEKDQEKFVFNIKRLENYGGRVSAPKNYFKKGEYADY